MTPDAHRYVKVTYPSGVSCVMSLRTARDIIRDELDGGWPGDSWTLEMTEMTEAEFKALAEFKRP